jgi:hypothetical protein
MSGTLCSACGASASSQGRLTADPAVEVYACTECGEFWVSPVVDDA